MRNTIPTDCAIDAAIAERVMGYRWYVSKATGRRALFVLGSQPGWFERFANGDEPLATYWDTSIERYSTDIDAAFRVVGEMERKGYHWQLHSSSVESGSWLVYVTSKPSLSEPFSWSNDHRCAAPLAICKAALAWAESRKESAR